MAMESLLSVVPRILESLPQVIQTVQIVVYIFLIFLFGKVAVKGLRPKLNYIFRTGLTVGCGVVCLVASTAVAGLFPVLETGIFQFLQLGMFLGGLVAAFIISIGLYLLSYGLGGNRIEKLEGELSKFKEVLLDNKVLEAIPENRAKKIGEERSGLSAREAELVKENWRVKVGKGKEGRMVVIDALTGEVKEVLRGSKIANFFSVKPRIVGVAVLVVFLILVLVNFQGLPSITESLSEIGLTPEVIANLSQAGEELKGLKGRIGGGVDSECMQLGTLTEEDMKNAEVYEDPEAKNRFEEEADSTVVQMSRLKKKGAEIIIAVTEDQRFCYSVEGKFCGCFEIGERR